MRHNTLMKSGEFAALCKTTKVTLRHYREIGLLEPVVREENGYLLYAPQQIADFLFITALRDSGCALSEIKGYLQSPDYDVLASLMTSRIEALIDQQQQLRLKQTLLENTLAGMQALRPWLDNPAVRWRIEKCAEERLTVRDLSTAFNDYEKEEHSRDNDPETTANPYASSTRTGQSLKDSVADKHSDNPLSDWIADIQASNVSQLQGMFYVERSAFLAGDYGQGFFACSPVTAEDSTPHIHIKPAGTYLKHLRITSLEQELAQENPIFAEYDLMRSYLVEHDLVTRGNLYEKELVPYPGTHDGTVYSELSIRIANR